MIVRILGEGQYQVGDEAAAKLTELDASLAQAVDQGDERAFHAALAAAEQVVKETGAPVPSDSLETAEFILPFPDATIDEVRKLLADGKIPGLPATGSGNV